MQHADGMNNFLQRLRPIHRFVGAFVLAVIAFVLLPEGMPLILKLIINWTVFALVYLVLSWLIIRNLPVASIRQMAGAEDGSKTFVFIMVLLASLASYGAVLFIIVSDVGSRLSQLTVFGGTLSAMLVSWLLIHTVYIFHYAHLYYAQESGNKPLTFPGDEEPDYMDFAYFSFVLGCCFQVSDVAITDKRLRRIALFHGLLSFGINTSVVALTINIISGMAR